MFTDKVHHNVLGDIHVYWDTKLTRVSFFPGHEELTAIHRDLRVDMPDVYDYLHNFGTTIPKFPFDIFRLDCTDFSVNVYKALFNTTMGQILTYGELATLAGYPKAARAVGSAMRRNNFPILIPCHRVVAANGIGNYTMGGVSTKLELLKLEGVNYYE